MRKTDPAGPVPHTIAQAWANNDGDTLHSATEQLLGAGLYTEPFLAAIAGQFASIEGSALRMDALNMAAAAEGLQIGPHAHQATLFAIPVVGTPANISAFAGNPARLDALGAALVSEGMALETAHITLLGGAWMADDLCALHPQMVRNTIGQACALMEAGSRASEGVLPALSSLPQSLPHRTGGNVGAVIFALLIEPPNALDDDVADPLRFLLEDGMPETIRGPSRNAVEDPAGTWKAVWDAHGPSESLSCLSPVLVGGAAAACVEVDAITALLLAGASPTGTVEPSIHATDTGGALIEMHQEGVLWHSHAITPTAFALIGASLLDRFNPTVEDEEALVGAEEAVPLAQPQARRVPAPLGAMDSFFSNLCPPAGRLH